NLIYESGPWNGHRPFTYNHDRPLGDHLPDKLLHNYLATRRGQCVSMPVLFLVLAEKLGVEMRLASAPHHMFLRYTDPAGRRFNIEATSGGHPARDQWYRRQFPMTDRAIESGLYMRTLSRRESVALMATTLLEHLVGKRRHEEAIDLAAVILEHDPRDAQVMVTQASCCGRLMETEFAAKYPVPFLIPEPARSRYRFLAAMNEALFARAEALGWEPDPQWEPPHVAAHPSHPSKKTSEPGPLTTERN
ncbi:MAG: transglutaminase-like domain-containing protein, partial [Pseudomonadota bacterium]|nr:transglutaminase-like domain-containing protein [Pseudomonadota bacterium]